MKAKLPALAVLALALAAPATSPAADEKDLVDVTVELKNHTILVTALREVGLADTLKGKGPFTLFAPTDTAFKSLGVAQIKTIMTDKKLLTQLLRAHVVEREAVYKKDLVARDGQSVNGFKIGVAGPVITVGDAKVTKADNTAYNGVVHAIDAVLIPAK